MSRRFGRNQRRRAREAVAIAEDIAARERSGRNMAEGLSSDLSRKLSEAREYQKRVSEIVGNQAICAGVATRLNFKGFDRMRLIPTIDMPACRYDMDDGPISNVSINYEVLRLLEISAVRDPIRAMMHARVDLADGRVGYAISEKALANLGARDLAGLIGPEITRSLAEEIVRLRGR